MSDWPVGISTGCFYQTPIFDVLETILRGGFLRVEISSFPGHLDYHNVNAVRKAAKVIGDLRMEAYSLHAPFAEHIDITSFDKSQREYSLQEILRAAEAASLLQVRHFVIHPGPEKHFTPPDEEHLIRIRNAAGILDQVSTKCRELGVGFVLENMLPHLLFGNTSDMLWIMGAIKALNVGTCLDASHASLSGDIYRVMYKLSGHLVLVHANDNHGLRDDHLPPGKGIIDWNRLVLELSETRFRGGIILEIAGDKSPELLLEEARESTCFIRSIARRLALTTPPTVGVPASIGSRPSPAP